MALLEDFKTRFPEFDISTADQYVPKLEPSLGCYWGGSYDTACGLEIVLNLLAHLITIETNGLAESVKGQSSRSVDGVSESFFEGMSNASQRGAWFDNTKYGQRFLFLTRRRQGGVFV